MDSSNNQFEAEGIKADKIKKRRKHRLIKLILVVCAVPLYILMAMVPGMIALYFDSDKRIDVVEDYTYNFNDVNSDLKVNPFPENLSTGRDYTFSDTDEKDRAVIELIVGEDIQPGVYTLKNTGGINVNTYLALETDFYYKQGVDYYNIPLTDGAVITIDMYTGGEKLPRTLELTAQSKYVGYKPGINGIFVYGLNQFDSEVVYKDGSYESLVYGYNQPTIKQYVTKTYNGDVDNGDVRLPGSPGSYFAVEYN